MTRSTGYDTFPEQSPKYISRLIFNQVDSNSFIASNKHHLNSEEEDDTKEKYNTNQTIIGDANSFLETLKEDTVALMNKDIKEKKKMLNNIEQDIKSLFKEIISYDINMTKIKLKPKEIEMMEDTNLFLEPISEETYIVNILVPILNKIFIKNKKS
ncbi:16455_t:CDS:2 [Racocetra fulgida]|uniref:16455_t:CDS:1 n=1 Tax=Racocetra fulgida TaxID=60492 RepID=A0A9N8ZLV7_9GLOM|nr:16455_t:CDS:2 [Racocetra fulgida]